MFDPVELGTTFICATKLSYDHCENMMHAVEDPDNNNFIVKNSGGKSSTNQLRGFYAWYQKYYL